MCNLNSKRHQFASLPLPHIVNACLIHKKMLFFFFLLFPSFEPKNSTCYRLMQSNQSKSRTYALIYIRGAKKIQRFVKFVTQQCIEFLRSLAELLSLCKNVFSFDGYFVNSNTECHLFSH